MSWLTKSLLHDACRLGLAGVVSALLSLDELPTQVTDGARNVGRKTLDVNECNPDDNDTTPLILASAYGHVAVVGILLNHPGIEVDRRDRLGRTALHLACVNNRLAVAVCLIEAGADPNILDQCDDTPLKIAIDPQNHTAIISYLLQCPGINVNAQRAGRMAALHHACEFGNLKIVKLLIEAGADPRTLGEYGKTALHVAVAEGHSDMVEYLVGCQDVNVNAQDSQMQTPLHCAFSYLISKILVEAGADVRLACDTGRTPIHRAADRWNADLVEYFVRHDPAAADLPCNKNESPIMRAAEYCHQQNLRFLARSSGGVNVNQVNTEGYSALNLAPRWHIDRTVPLLRLLIAYKEVFLRGTVQQGSGPPQGLRQGRRPRRDRHGGWVRRYRRQFL